VYDNNEEQCYCEGKVTSDEGQSRLVFFLYSFFSLSYLFFPLANVLLLISKLILFDTKTFSLGIGKTKGKIPINQRGEYMKQQKMMEARSKMLEQQPQGVPVFKVFVRPKAGGPWIPCGDLAGDDRAKAVVEAMMAGFLKDMYKGNLDTGVARSIFSQEEAFVKNLIENFKPFRKFTPDMLEFGYKVEYPGLVEKLGEQKIQLLEKEMQKTWVDNVQEKFSGLFGGKK